MKIPHGLAHEPARKGAKGKGGGGVLALGKLYDHSLCFLWCRRV